MTEPVVAGIRKRPQRPVTAIDDLLPNEARSSKIHVPGLSPSTSAPRTEQQTARSARSRASRVSERGPATWSLVSARTVTPAAPCFRLKRKHRLPASNTRSFKWEPNSSPSLCAARLVVFHLHLRSTQLPPLPPAKNMSRCFPYAQELLVLADRNGIEVMLDLHSCSNRVAWRAGRLDARPPSSLRTARTPPVQPPGIRAAFPTSSHTIARHGSMTCGRWLASSGNSASAGNYASRAHPRAGNACGWRPCPLRR